MRATPETYSKNCAMCGSPYGTSLQPFRFGARSFDLPVCQSCWKRHEASRVVLWTAVPVGILALVGGVALSVMTDGVAPTFVGIILGVGLVLWAIFFRSNSRPKRVKGDGVTIVVPSVGKVRVD